MQDAPPGSDSDAASIWLQKLAAAEPASSPLPDAQVLWWQAQALRRIDEQRRLTAALDTGEHIQLGGGIAAAIGLLIWLVNAAPGAWLAPPFTLLLTLCSTLMAATLALALWDGRRDVD